MRGPPHCDPRRRPVLSRVPALILARPTAQGVGVVRIIGEHIRETRNIIERINDRSPLAVAFRLHADDHYVLVAHSFSPMLCRIISSDSGSVKYISSATHAL